MIVPKHYENLSVLHEGTMPDRAYYVPAGSCMECLDENREASDRITMLNGNWKFRYFDSIYDLQEKFYLPDFNLSGEGSGFEEIPVPGVWQNYGYDCHQYTNVRYPFPVDPPYVPHENHCGAFVWEWCDHAVYKGTARDGIGSNSCGPRPLPKYRFDDRHFTYDMTLLPACEPAE